MFIVSPTIIIIVVVIIIILFLCLCLIYLTEKVIHAHKCNIVKSSHRIEFKVYNSNQVNVSIICCFNFVLSLFIIFSSLTTENGFIVKCVQIFIYYRFSLQNSRCLCLNCILFVSKRIILLLFFIVRAKTFFIPLLCHPQQSPVVDC